MNMMRRRMTTMMVTMMMVMMMMMTYSHHGGNMPASQDQDNEDAESDTFGPKISLLDFLQVLALV